MIDLTIRAVDADEFSGYLSGPKNFRYDIFPEYKANRQKQVRPRHLTDLKDYLQNKYNAVVSDGCEADDLLGIEQCKSTNTIICSLDKDLKQIPGEHYSFEISGTSSLGKRWTKEAERVTVTPEQGLRFFYYQLLVGDATDNIRGAPGIGKVKAEVILRDCVTEQDLFNAVEAHYPSMEELEMNGKVLYIWKRENDEWKIPHFGT